MWHTLSFILFVSACRAASEDIAKHKSDDARNRAEYLVRRDKGWKKVESGKLQVGNIVKVLKNQMMPTDMVFLGSSNKQGHCHIDKANLNGETTLEVVTSVAQARKYVLDDQSGIDSFRCRLIYEPPNPRFDKFRGVLTIKTEGGQDEQSFYVEDKACLMRETNLRNTDFIVGIVVYTGNDTKIQVADTHCIMSMDVCLYVRLFMHLFAQVSNSLGSKDKAKVSRIFNAVNDFLWVMFALQLLLCIAAGTMCGVWITNHGAPSWYDNLVNPNVRNHNNPS
jgi:magnesium-transporting ATPase (P-type)